MKISIYADVVVYCMVNPVLKLLLPKSVIKNQDTGKISSGG